MERVTKAIKDLIFPHGSSTALRQGLSFERSMLDASVDCIKVITVDGRLMTMNRAGCIALDVPEDSAFGMPWLPLLSSAVHAAGEQALEEARRGHSARFPGRSEKDGEIRYWDNLLTPVFDGEGIVQIILCVSRDVTVKTLLEQKLEEAVAREQLLAQEMRHRIKNLYAVVSGLISLSEKEASQSADIPRLLREKLAAFSRVSDAIFEPSTIAPIDHDQIDMGLIVRSILRPYANKYRAEGSPCAIPRAQLTPIILFLHELATNSIKYGAFSPEGGTVHITWITEGGLVLLKWLETCGAPIRQTTRDRGFGTDMVERLARSIDGIVTREWASNGFVTELRFPQQIQEV